MAKQSILKNKKILWSSAGVLLTSGVITGVLVPVLTSKDDVKEKVTKLTLTKKIINAKTSNDTITAMQKFYGLEIKKASAVNDLEIGELKSKYQSARNLATFIFTNKNSYQTLFVQGKEQTTNLQEIVLIMTPKNVIREQDNTGNWPANQVDAQDQFNFLITFFKGKVVRVRKLIAKTAVVNDAKIFFKVKTYDLVNLFYQFKNASSQASDFGYYNAYLDNENNTQGLALFKKYLLTLKTQDSTITNVDLTGVQFTKKSHNSATKTATAELRFSYQGLSTTKTISDFQYKVAYKLTLKAEVENKMADEVQITDIDTTNLPSDVTISGVKTSTENTDGSVIKITFSGGTITSQNLPGLTSYQAKSQSLLEGAESSDFTITGQSKILPSAYNDEVALLNQLKAKANAITNDNAKTKVKEILGTATITFAPNDQTGELSFTITIGAINKTFAISDLDTFNSINKVNKRIDAEVARKTKPTIKPESEIKWGARASIEDIIITSGDSTLISKIKNVVLKKGDDIHKKIAGSIVSVTIEVSSSIRDTKTSQYEIDLGGFWISEFLSWWKPLITVQKIIKNSDFKIPEKNNILPSKFKNINLIKNVLKDDKYFQVNTPNWLIIYFKKQIDNNRFKITFDPDDVKGILKFRIQLPDYRRTFTITGFKTSMGS